MPLFCHRSTSSALLLLASFVRSGGGEDGKPPSFVYNISVLLTLIIASAAVGHACFALAPSGSGVFLSVVGLALSPYVEPALRSRAARCAPRGKQGLLHGALRALSTLGFAVGTPAFGALFAWSVGSGGSGTRAVDAVDAGSDGAAVADDDAATPGTAVDEPGGGASGGEGYGVGEGGERGTAWAGLIWWVSCGLYLVAMVSGLFFSRQALCVAPRAPAGRRAV